MAFRFGLQAVLHYRHSVEHQQELYLRAANQQVARVRRVIAQIDEQIVQLRAIKLRDLSGGTTFAELQFNSNAEVTLQLERQKFQNELLRLQRLRDQQQRVFEEARQNRQVLETVHAQKFRAYKRELSRREQRQLDDLMLLRRSASSADAARKN